MADAAIFYPPPPPQRSTPKVVQPGVAADAPPIRVSDNRLRPIHLAWLEAFDGPIQSGARGALWAYEPSIPLLAFEWAELAVPGPLPERLLFQWIEFAARDRARLVFSWNELRPFPVLRLTWNEVLADLYDAQHEDVQEPVAEVEITQP